MTSLLKRKQARVDALAESAGTSLAADALRRMLRSPVALLGAFIVLVFLALAVVAPFIAPKDPYQRYPELLEDLRPDFIPGAQPGFLLGGDELGRDFFSRLLVGAQQSLIVGVGAGWNKGEFDLVGASFESRGKVLDESTGSCARLVKNPRHASLWNRY